MSDSIVPNPPYPPAPFVPPAGPVIPMSFGQILDRIFRLVRRHWKPFVGIGFMPIGALAVFEGVVFGALFADGVFHNPPAQPNAATILSIVVPLIVLGVPVLLLAYGVYYAAASYAALQADHGCAVTAIEALRHAWSKAGRYAWLIVLRSLIVAIPIFVLVFAVGLGAMLLGLAKPGNVDPTALFFLVPLAILLYAGAVVYAILMSLRLSLAFPACVEEGITARQAIKRSGVLTQGAKGRIFLMLLVIYAISYAVVLVFYAVGLFVFAIVAVAGSGHMHDMTPLGFAAVGLVGACALVLVVLWSMLLMAAYSTAFAVFYRDQRLRQEGPWQAPLPAAETA